MRRIKQNIQFLLVTLVFGSTLLTFHACSDDDFSDSTSSANEESVADDSDFEATDWTTATHSKDADPNFDEVFEDNTVKRLDIVITEERWQSMLDNMTELYGPFGGSNTGGPGQGGPGGPIDSGNTTDVDEDPIFVPAEVFYEGIEWYRVGVRFKGNSSLQTSWQSGILKLSLKLDFDEYEDDYPQIDNQRFYGFKKLSLKNNFDDQSMLREKVATDVFRNAGLVASHTAFYTVYIDHGDGPQYFGLYTMVEEVDDTVLDTQYADNDGNLYKPDGDAASFALGTFNTEEYVKKTNEDEADFSDVQSLLSILHDESRTTNPEAWRTSLESTLDTDVFLKYLAVNTVVQNWDTYGRMTHNYYLYNNPDTGKLNWIPWDNNEALQFGKLEGALPLDFSNLDTEAWPLIGYLYQDTVYKSQYDTYVQEVVNDAFSVSNMQALYASYASLVQPYATTEVSGYSFLTSSADFQAAVNELNSHVVERVDAVSEYLN
ncbi:CotH kinase family protein [Bizionia sp. KMM 8389]